MKNELFSIGPFTVYGYGLMIAIGIIAAYLAGEYRAKKYGLEADHVFNYVIWCVVGGFSGSKLLYFITNIKNIVENPDIMRHLADGWVVYGGIIGGILSAMLYWRDAVMERRQTVFWVLYFTSRSMRRTASGFCRPS